MKDNPSAKNTKKKLLDSAAVIFSKKGYGNTSVAEICKMAEANIASVNYYFRSKDALYREVIHYTHQQAVTLYPIELDESIPPEEKLFIIIYALIQRILTRKTIGNFHALMAKEMAEPSLASGQLINEIIAPKRSMFQKVIKEIYGEPADDELIYKLTYSTIHQCIFLSCNEKGRKHHFNQNAHELKDAKMIAKHITNFSLAGIKYYGRL